jgi:hypothetical protein
MMGLALIVDSPLIGRKGQDLVLDTEQRKEDGLY